MIFERDGAATAYDVTRAGNRGGRRRWWCCCTTSFATGGVRGAVAALRERHTTIAIDFRGHGESPVGLPYTVADLVADVVAVLDREAVDRATVVGLSLGATVALELALARPDAGRGTGVMGADAEPDGGIARLRNAAFCLLVRLFGMRGFVLGGVERTLFGAWFRSRRRGSRCSAPGSRRLTGGRRGWRWGPGRGGGRC